MDARRFAPLYRSLALCTALPLAAVLLLQLRFGLSLVAALGASAVFPIVDIAIDVFAKRRLEPLGAMMLVVILAGIAASLATGDPRFALVKESFATGLVSAFFLGSLLAPRPLIFWLGRQFSTRGDRTRVMQWDANWQYPRFRGAMRLLTAVWGAGYLFDAVARAVAAYALPAPVTVVLSPLSALGTTAALIAWTVAFARRRGSPGDPVQRDRTRREHEEDRRSEEPAP